LRLSNERVIERLPVPVGVCDLVKRAGSNEQRMPVGGVVFEDPIWLVEKEAEPTLQADRDVRPCPLPATPFREGLDLRQVISVGKLLEQQVGQWRRRFSYCEPRVGTALNEGYAPAALQ